MSDVDFNEATSDELSMKQGTVVFVACCVAIQLWVKAANLRKASHA